LKEILFFSRSFIVTIILYIYYYIIVVVGYPHLWKTFFIVVVLRDCEKGGMWIKSG